MKKFAGLAAVLVVLGMMGVFAPESSADHDCVYICPIYWSVTDDLWGLAPTCAEAHAAAIRAVEDQAYQRCGGDVCEFGAVTIVTPCMPKEDMPWLIREDVNIQYKCGRQRCTLHPEYQ